MFFNKYIEYVSLTSLRYREWDQLQLHGFSTIFQLNVWDLNPSIKGDQHLSSVQLNI